jgi:hypothetical protein
MSFNINTDAAIKFTNKLEKIARSALPMAARGTLNSLAFDVKMKTMPTKAAKTFKQREKNFFKANSRVQTAFGYNINTMEATVGFSSASARFNNHAVQELEQQEKGGDIDKRSFVPLDGARAGGSSRGKIRANARLSKIRNIVESKDMHGKNKKEQFVRAVNMAGKGGYVLSGKILWRIDSINKKGKYKKTALYTFKKGRKVHVESTNFMKFASLQSAEKGELFYKQNAERTIAKYK